MVDEKEKNNTQQDHTAKPPCRRKIILKFCPRNHPIYYRADIESCIFICYKKQSIAGYNLFSNSLNSNAQEEYIKQQYRLQDRNIWNTNQVQDYEHAYCIQSFYNLQRLLCQQSARVKIDDKQLQQATCMFDSNLVKWLLNNYHPQDTQRQSISTSVTTYYQPPQLRHHQHQPCCYKSIKHPTKGTAVPLNIINETKGIDTTSMQHTPTTHIIQKPTSKLHTNMIHQINDQRCSIQLNKDNNIEATSQQQPNHPQDICFDIYTSTWMKKNIAWQNTVKEENSKNGISTEATKYNNGKINTNMIVTK